MAEWFEEWFDSEYYHLLYKDRDHKEATDFINKLISHIQLQKDSSVLDVACGSGRHALQFSNNGFNTVGIDLSKNSINAAKEYESDRLHFQVEDMRDFNLKTRFDLITNLFTSFGYFSDLGDNLRALKVINQHLEAHGLFVLDFMNTERVIKNLVEEEKKTLSNIDFHLKRKYESGLILKEIKFSDKENKEHVYTEKVQAIKYNDFLALFDEVNLEVVDCFADYTLSSSYNIDADRMIFILKKS